MLQAQSNKNQDYKIIVNHVQSRFQREDVFSFLKTQISQWGQGNLLFPAQQLKIEPGTESTYDGSFFSFTIRIDTQFLQIRTVVNEIKKLLDYGNYLPRNPKQDLICRAQIINDRPINSQPQSIRENCLAAAEGRQMSANLQLIQSLSNQNQRDDPDANNQLLVNNNQNQQRQQSENPFGPNQNRFASQESQPNNNSIDQVLQQLVKEIQENNKKNETQFKEIKDQISKQEQNNAEAQLKLSKEFTSLKTSVQQKDEMGPLKIISDLVELKKSLDDLKSERNTKDKQNLETLTKIQSGIDSLSNFENQIRTNNEIQRKFNQDIQQYMDQKDKAIENITSAYTEKIKEYETKNHQLEQNVSQLKLNIEEMQKSQLLLIENLEKKRVSGNKEESASDFESSIEELKRVMKEIQEQNILQKNSIFSSDFNSTQASSSKTSSDEALELQDKTSLQNDNQRLLSSQVYSQFACMFQKFEEQQKIVLEKQAAFMLDQKEQIDKLNQSISSGEERLSQNRHNKANLSNQLVINSHQSIFSEEQTQITSRQDSQIEQEEEKQFTVISLLNPLNTAKVSIKIFKSTANYFIPSFIANKIPKLI